MEENPFADLKINSSDFLDSLNGRGKCSKCQKSRKYYCYNCYVSVPEIEEKVPKVKLPLKIDVIKHPSEVDGKSTAVHAAVIAPDDVTVYTYPCIPDYDDKNKVVLVFPGETSITLAELANKWGINSNTERCTQKRKACNENDNVDCCTTVKVPRLENEEGNKAQPDNLSSDRTLITDDKLSSCDTEKGPDFSQTDISDKSIENASSCDEQSGLVTDVQNKTSDRPESNEDESGQVPSFKLERVVFIDSTWNQTRTICSDERLTGLQCIELKTRETKFWRHQKDIPDTYLSTVEAMYYFLREYHEHFIQTNYNGEYDNLLFFFTYMYRKIRMLYNGGNELKAYKKRK